MEYLKIAQDLEMYGVSYFSITVSLYLYFLKICIYCTLVGRKLTSAKLNLQLQYNCISLAIF